MNSEGLQEIIDVIKALIESLALIIAGIWTYLLFVRQRLGLPRVNIKPTITHVRTSGEWTLIHVEVKIENIGSVVLRSDKAEIRIRQVLPFPDDVQRWISLGYDPVENGRTEVEWPLIADRKWNWAESTFEIEPGESDSLHADFVIPGSIFAIELYAFIANTRKKRQGLGWTLTEVYKIDPSREHSDLPREKQDRFGSEKKQQQQQQQQRQQQQRQQQQQQFLSPRPS